VKRALLICLIVAGCKQGEGERCQVDDDCQAPLVCNKAKNTCQGTSGGDLDASIPDGPKADAAVDAGSGSGSATGPAESF
jgi:hypothetical protein